MMSVCTVERIAAFPAQDHMQFAGMMQDVAPYVLPKAAGALGPSADLLQLAADKAEMFHALWIMVMAAKPTFLRNAAFSLGFGVLDFTVKRSLEPPLSPIFAKSSTASTFEPQAGPKRFRGAEPAEVSPLMEIELQTKA